MEFLSLFGEKSYGLIKISIVKTSIDFYWFFKVKPVSESVSDLIKVYVLYFFSFDCYHIRSYWFLKVKPVKWSVEFLSF